MQHDPMLTPNPTTSDIATEPLTQSSTIENYAVLKSTRSAHFERAIPALHESSTQYTETQLNPRSSHPHQSIAPNLTTLPHQPDA
jgi:hypothetical protein